MSKCVKPRKKTISKEWGISVSCYTDEETTMVAIANYDPYDPVECRFTYLTAPEVKKLSEWFERFTKWAEQKGVE